MAIVNSFLYVYQRVIHHYLSMNICNFLHPTQSCDELNRPRRIPHKNLFLASFDTPSLSGGVCFGPDFLGSVVADHIDIYVYPHDCCFTTHIFLKQSHHSER